MSLKRILMIIPAGMFLLSSIPTLAQSEPGIDSEIPSDIPAPVDSAPVEPEPSVDTEITPETDVAPSDPSNIGGSAPSGPNSLVQCGPSSAAFVVTKVPVGCHVLDVNSPPGQSGNAES